MSFIPPTFVTTQGNVIPGQRGDFGFPQGNTAFPLSGRVNTTSQYPPGYPPGYPNHNVRMPIPQAPAYTSYTNPFVTTPSRYYEPNIEVNVHMPEVFSPVYTPIYTRHTPVYTRPHHHVSHTSRSSLPAFTAIVTLIAVTILLLPLLPMLLI